MRKGSLLPIVVLVAVVGAGSLAAQSGNAALSAMDRIQIQQLVARYAYALDTGADNGYAYADLFADDGVFVGMNQGPTGRSFRGRDTLAALARGGPRGQNYVSHFITNGIIEATPEGARGTQYAIIADLGENQKPSSWTHGGHYEDAYVKTPAGWRFKSRVFFASEGGPNPKQLQSNPLAAPAARPADPAPRPARAEAPAGAAPRVLSADDYIEIQQLIVRYPYALDTGANNGFDYADLFTPDAEFSRPVTRGRDNLAKLALAQPHGPRYVRHYLTNHVIEPTAAGAIGKEYLVVIDIGEAGKPSRIFVGGHYEDIYEKMSDGWRFKRREFIPSRKAVTAPEASAQR